MTLITTQRPLPPDAIAGIASVAEACDVLRAWGYADLADRLGYLASDADLEDGDLPARLESVRGFLAFFGAVETDGEMHLGCSREGWVCAEWDYPDQRDAGLWFLDDNRMMYTASNQNGKIIDFNLGSKIGDRVAITESLVESRLFTWFKARTGASFSLMHTT